ncbi:MAG: hypothetical protein QNL62_07655 [Gammaproteobacteria bacterium]|nr:hypothetical protein [Gammaproteobacteria bacterium]
MAADNDNRNVQGKKRKTLLMAGQILFFSALTVFFVFAAFGFYSLVGDVHRMADSVGVNMSTMAGQMQRVSSNLDELTGSVRSIAVNLDDLTVRVHDMGDTMVAISGNVETLQPMLGNLDAMKVNMGLIDNNMASMNQSIGSMNQSIGNMNKQVGSMNHYMSSMSTSTHLINQNISGLNQNFDRPMSLMNKFAPW